ncbi:MAG: class B sortase [Lachnospiraceae bacterium]|nr:class B sortase [Lachnospiraceae bacterium]MCM1238720.1 class B sortase [Lachnospiraceae bacterium]MCM1342629.1 class B sortase [Muribaculaceae bacterium]MCM1409739.1 class B sortase [Lachnospiraceae bacterium]
MQKTSGQKIIKIAAGIVGLALVFFFGVWISRQIYHRPDAEAASASQAEELAEAASAPTHTEEELEELYRSIKETALLSGGSEEVIGILSGKDPAGSDGNAQEPGNGQTEVDFEYLWTVNEDIIAWITIPGTNIDYPVLRHPSNDGYYLNHNIDGSPGYPGCIYIESLNSADFTDANTVLYGHNLKAKTMFTELHRFENRDFFDENDEVIIYLPDRELHYQIFAAHVYDDRHLLYSFDFADEDIYAGFLQSIYDIRDMSANINRDLTVTSQDRIITMSTCMPNKADAEKRLLVHAVLLQE